MSPKPRETFTNQPQHIQHMLLFCFGSAAPQKCAHKMKEIVGTASITVLSSDAFASSWTYTFLHWMLYVWSGSVRCIEHAFSGRLRGALAFVPGFGTVFDRISDNEIGKIRWLMVGLILEWLQFEFLGRKRCFATLYEYSLRALAI